MPRTRGKCEKLVRGQGQSEWKERRLTLEGRGLRLLHKGAKQASLILPGNRGSLLYKSHLYKGDLIRGYSVRGEILKRVLLKEERQQL